MPAAPDSKQPDARRPIFPGWRWLAVGLAFPIAGLIGWKVGGHVDAVGAALVGGALTGAGLGAVEWWAADGALGRAAAWIASHGAWWPNHTPMSCVTTGAPCRRAALRPTIR